MADQALTGTTVIDLTTGTDGPYATKLLADLGARVIKVEPVEGDPSRQRGPFPGDVPNPEHSALFRYLNTSKEGVTLDLATGEGQARLKALVQSADILIENFTPGTMAGWGLGYEHLKQDSPALVYVSLTPFGQEGPYSTHRGPDIVRQALSGWLFQGGRPDREPMKSGGEISYYLAGTATATAALIALYHARATGAGQHVDISAVEVLIACTGQEIHKSYVSGPESQFTRTGHRFLPITIVPCRDGIVGINILSQPNWEAFCKWADMEDIFADPRYASLLDLRNPARGAELHDRLIAWTMQHDAIWLVEEGQKRRIAVSPVPDMKATLELPQHQARGYLHTISSPETGDYVQPGAPYVLSETPWALGKPAPRLGEDNQAVFGAAELQQKAG